MGVGGQPSHQLHKVAGTLKECGSILLDEHIWLFFPYSSHVFQICFNKYILFGYKFVSDL